MTRARRRRVPVAAWRRLLARLHPAAIAAGNERGLSLDAYQADRDGIGAEALDRALQRQVDLLADALTKDRAPGSLGGLLNELRRGVNPDRRPYASQVGGPGGVARYLREARTDATALAELLRDLADVADVVALGLGLRAGDHDAEQALDDRLAALRPKRTDP
jgi:hypothetical protein